MEDNEDEDVPPPPPVAESSGPSCKTFLFEIFSILWGEFVEIVEFL